MDGKIENKNKKSFSWFIFLQFVIIIYTLSGVCAKYASGSSFFSFNFFLFYGFELLILAIYALLWQQVIKKFDLSIAYANRACALLWSMVWSVLFFQEVVTIKNLIGVLIVILGTIIVNKESV